MSTTKLSSVTEKEDAASGSGSGSSALALVPVKPRPTTVRASKWGRLLGSSSADSGSEGGPSTPGKSGCMDGRYGCNVLLISASGKESTKPASNGGNGNGHAPQGSGNKVFPKLQKVASTSGPSSQAVSTPMITRQDTIEEMIEVDDASRGGLSRALAVPSKSLRRIDTIVDTRPGTNLRKVDSYDSGIIKSLDAKLDKESCGASAAVLPQQILPNVEYKELMSNMMDFKVDVKLEVQRINQKIGRLEELLTELVVKLSDSSSKESKTEEEAQTAQQLGPQPQRCIKVTARASSAMGVSSTTIPSGAGER